MKTKTLTEQELTAIWEELQHEHEARLKRRPADDFTWGFETCLQRAMVLAEVALAKKGRER